MTATGLPSLVLSGHGRQQGTARVPAERRELARFLAAVAPMIPRHARVDLVVPDGLGEPEMVKYHVAYLLAGRHVRLASHDSSQGDFIVSWGTDVEEIPGYRTLVHGGNGALLMRSH